MIGLIPNILINKDCLDTGLEEVKGDTTCMKEDNAK